MIRPEHIDFRDLLVFQTHWLLTQYTSSKRMITDICAKTIIEKKMTSGTTIGLIHFSDEIFGIFSHFGCMSLIPIQFQDLFRFIIVTSPFLSTLLINKYNAVATSIPIGNGAISVKKGCS
jgi:hypothetical protein